MSRATPGRISAAVLLPPLGTYLARGPGRDFLITCGLTVLGFVPGAAYALWSVVRREGVAERLEPAKA
ncbi:YqaE/Pmp3 family membrane protein [Sphingomonas sp. MMS12-HWE2-04]|uniref:YqaE/Pmp3 family membrane protein n=1 Tax=Sphingomonas sp. MMS12-HWE2-04 TaxID=3234199 RepID=UPI00384DB987